VKKGLFSLEYLTVIVIFMAFTTYYAFRMIEEKPNYLEEVKAEIYRSECYRISELLINDPGHPLNWDTLDLGQVERVGLSNHYQNKTNLLSENKITRLGELCQGNGYYDVKELMGISYNYHILIKSMEGTFDDVECGSYDEENVKASMTRLITFDSGSFGNLTVDII